METAALVAPVTALEFLQEEYLLKGEGPILTVYGLHPRPKACKASLSVLQHYRIHGIRPRPQRNSTTENHRGERGGSSSTESSHYDLAVYGGKAVRLVRLRTELHRGDHLHLETIGPLMELQDWALDAHWLSGEGRPLLGVALAHNGALLLDAEKGKALVQCSCLEGCLLYSALLLVDKSWTDSVLVGGTVFNQLVLWRPGSGGTEGNDAQLKAPVERRLLGHSGVIFSLSYLQEKGWLASASDDRSVRVWGVGVLGGPGGTCGDLNPTCLRVLYGHQARVFSVRLSPGKVYSAGEDGACLVWDWAAGGKVARTLKGHRAGGVRALAVSGGRNVHDARQSSWVATGGADGGVRLWRLEGDKEKDLKESGVTMGETVNELDMKFIGQGTPKGLCVTGRESSTGGLSEFQIVVCTDRGIVYRYCDGQWEPLWQGPVEFQSYCVMETLTVRIKDSSPQSTVHLCAVGNLVGGVQVFPLSQPQSGVLLSGGQGKIHSLVWVGDDAQESSGRHGGGYLLASGADGLVHRWYVEVDMDEESHVALRVETLTTFLLPYTAKRWLTAAVRLHSRTAAGDVLWVCGDRRGSLLLFVDERRTCEQREKEEEGRRRDLLVGRTDGSKADEKGDVQIHGDGTEEKDGGLMEVKRGTEECNPPLKPESRLFGAHGKQGVTSVCEYRGLLYSAGRDGCVRVFRLQTTDKGERLEENAGADCEEKRGGPAKGLQLEVLRVQRACKGMEWLERVLILEPERSLTDLSEHSREEEENCLEDRVSSQGRGEEEETKRETEGRETRFVIAGFHADHFVVWDPVRQERLLSVPCGGGHRSWGLWPLSHEALWPGHGTLVFIKQGAVMASQPPGEMSSIRAGKAGGKTWDLREGVHGRAIGCVCRLGRMEGMRSNEVQTQANVLTTTTAGAEESSDVGHWEILVTGGEDTRLSVLAVEPHSGEVQVLSVITDHISSVRTVAAITCSGQRHIGTGNGGGMEMEGPKQPISALLVSAGGRAQLQCYRLMISWDGQRQLPSCQVIQVASHRLDEQWERRRNRHKMVKMDPETRYMSIAVVKEEKDCVHLALACSDGAVRLFSVSEVKGHFELLWESFYHHRCVLSLATCWTEDGEGNRHVLLFSAATDGNIAVWDVTTLQPPISTLVGSKTDTPAPPIPRFSIPAHHNGINSLVVWAEESAERQEDGCRVTVASGGDDGQLTVSMVRVQYLVDAIEGSRVLSPAEEQLSEEPGYPLHNHTLSPQTGLPVSQTRPLQNQNHSQVQTHSQFKPCHSRSPHTHPESSPSTPPIPPYPDSLHPPSSHLNLHLQSQSRVPLAHAAPLTALSLLSPGLLVSTSPDQRICLWRVRKGAGIVHSGTLYSHVADAAGMAVWKDGGVPTTVEENVRRRAERGGGVAGTETGRESETDGSESGSEAAGDGGETSVRIDGKMKTEAAVAAVGGHTPGAGCRPAGSETGSEAMALRDSDVAAGGGGVKTLPRAGWVLACGQGLQLIRVSDVETEGGMESEEERRKRGLTEQRVTVTFEENGTWKDES